MIVRNRETSEIVEEFKKIRQEYPYSDETFERIVRKNIQPSDRIDEGRHGTYKGWLVRKTHIEQLDKLAKKIVEEKGTDFSKKDYLILDCGGGDGSYIIEAIPVLFEKLQKQGVSKDDIKKYVKIYSFDLCKEAVEKYAKKIETLEYSSCFVESVRGNSIKIPFKKKFDLLIDIDGAAGAQDSFLILAEYSNHLKTGGLFFLFYSGENEKIKFQGKPLLGYYKTDQWLKFGKYKIVDDHVLGIIAQRTRSPAKRIFEIRKKCILDYDFNIEIGSRYTAPDELYKEFEKYFVVIKNE